MKQLPGYSVGNNVCHLKRSLYGLKQAARSWDIEINNVLKQSGCKQSESDLCLYSIKSDGNIGYVIIHVNDMLIAGDESMIERLAADIASKFAIKDLGEVSQFLGIEITKDEESDYFIDQTKYIEKIVSTVKMNDAKPSRIPLDTGFYKLKCSESVDKVEYQKLIGMLLYVAVNSRPDIAASVSILSQKISKKLT